MTLPSTNGRPERIRVGLIGYGYWGPNLARVLTQLRTHDVDLVAIAEREPAQRMRVEETYPTVDLVTEGREIIEDDTIDAVVIATPVGSHFDLAAPALRAGKHVFVEKPLAATIPEAEELVSLARREDLVLMVGHVFEYTEAVRYIKEVIDSGELGDILYIRSLRVNLGIYQTDINVLWDLAPHDLSIINYLLGAEPAAVSAFGQAHVTEGVPDIVNLNLDFDFRKRTLATVVVSWLDPRKIREMTIIGSKKMLVYDDVSSTEKIRVYDKGVDGPSYYDSFGEFHYAYRYGSIVSPMLEHREPLGDECRHFIDCIRLGKEPKSGGSSGLRVVRSLAAAQASLDRDGARIFLDDPMVNEASGRVDHPHGERSVTMGRRAIVIHGDESTSRLVASGLRVFRPGYEVVTARTLSRAVDWLRGEPLDLVVVEMNGHEATQIARWAEENHMDVGDIVLVGAEDRMTADLGFGGELPGEFHLSALLAVVRSMNQAKGSKQ